MHGHRLRLEADLRHVTLWTDISVGAVYGAMTRLASEGLLREAGQERKGRRPVRQVYEITDEGRHALADLVEEGLRAVWFRYDPFDLALTRWDASTDPDLPAVLSGRLEATQAMLAEARRVSVWARPYIGLAKQWALKHTEYRLEAEVAYLSDLLPLAAEMVADERG